MMPHNDVRTALNAMKDSLLGANLTIECECGCGVKFKPAGIGNMKRYASNACRVREWRRTHIRTIKNKRPRAKRKNKGIEIQMDDWTLKTLDLMAEAFGARNRSEACCLLIRMAVGRVAVKVANQIQGEADDD